MKRLGSLTAVLAVFAVGAGTAAAAGGASIHLKAPSSISKTKQFSVTVSGHAPSSGKQFVFVMFTKHSSCAASIGAGKTRGDGFVPFAGHKDGAQVSHGAYNVKSEKVHGGAAGSGHLCGYLYAGTQSINSKPEAHASHAIRFT